jgi:hypothetical protein
LIADSPAPGQEQEPINELEAIVTVRVFKNLERVIGPASELSEERTTCLCCGARMSPLWTREF